MDIAQLMQAAPPDPLAAAPAATLPAMGVDPALDAALGNPATGLDPMMMGAAPMPLGPGAGMGGIGAFPSASPDALAQIVQDAILQAQMQDAQMLEMQQAQAQMAAQPIIEQMMAQSAMAPAPDPMMAFGEGAGMPPLPPEEMMA